MTDQYPITPPLKVIQEWMFDLHFSLIPHPNYGQMDAQPHWIELVERAAQWGADQELAACCVLLDEWGLDAEDLMECRRPKPLSLKEQVLKELVWVDEHLDMPLHNHCNAIHTIRRALEQLND